ncbi:MAG: hypothetical protein QOF84_6516 [Streptomyces sp.]|jgi:hypothetical protein|nr:hypothetical protein [Streptomyces sp.]
MDAGLKYFGFYDSMPYALGGGDSVTDLIGRDEGGDEGGEVRERAARYLSRCETIIVVPGVEEDPLDESRCVISAFSVHSDGEWAWPLMAAHLVENHGMRVPRGLLDRMASRKWQPVSLSRDEIISVYERIKGDLYP